MESGELALMFHRVLKFAFLAAVALAPAVSQEPQHSPFVRAAGEATVTANPDRVTIDIGVTTQASTAQAASAQNAKRLEAVMGQIRQAFGSAAEIKTAGYSVNPDYHYPPQGGQPTIAGYSANHILQVKLDDVSLAGKLIDLATQSGANTIHSLQFSLKDESAVQAQALREAAVKARRKAETMASALGMRIVRIVSAEEGGVNVIRPMMVEAMGMQARAAGVPTPVASGTIEIHATVTVTAAVSQ